MWHLCDWAEGEHADDLTENCSFPVLAACDPTFNTNSFQTEKNSTFAVSQNIFNLTKYLATGTL